MFVKKFEAASLEQALSQIRSEFGPDALVLSSQTKGGKLFQKSFVEVTAARLKEKEKSESGGVSEEDLLKVFPHRKLKPAREESEAKAPTERMKSGPGIEMERIDRALKELRVLEGEFVRQGFSEKSASDLAKRLKYEYAKSDLAIPTFLEKAKVGLIASALRTLTPDYLETQSRFTLVGFPGSGKTTTAIKLAIAQKLQGKKVALSSLENRKLMGARELHNYGKLLKLPWVSQPSPLAQKNSTVFIDTTAVPVGNEEAMEKFARTLEGTTVLLTVDATARASEIIRLASHLLKRIPISALCFTKLDLISQPGVLYDVLRTVKLPLLGASLGSSFKTTFKFFQPSELGSFLIKHKGVYA